VDSVGEGQGENVNESDLFLCERFHCRMRKEVCVERQRLRETMKRGMAFQWLKLFPECQKCRQGGEIKYVRHQRQYDKEHHDYAL
jgi:hypothetical protein